MRKITICVLALGLAACQTTKQTVTVPAAPVDAKIAKVSEDLAKQCAAAKVLITLADLYVSDSKVQLAVDTADATVTRFCAKPPQNVNDAILLVAQVATDLNTAINAAGAK